MGMTEHQNLTAVLESFVIAWRLEADEADQTARSLLMDREETLKKKVPNDPTNQSRFIQQSAEFNRDHDARVIMWMDRATRLRQLADAAANGLLVITNQEHHDFKFNRQAAQPKDNRSLPDWLIGMAESANRLKVLD